MTTRLKLIPKPEPTPTHTSLPPAVSTAILQATSALAGPSRMVRGSFTTGVALAGLDADLARAEEAIKAARRGLR